MTNLDEKHQTFEEFLLEWTGRDIEYHTNYKTTGLEFAESCWKRAEEQCGKARQWQPIDTAPFVEEPVLLRFINDDVRIGYRDRDYDGAWCDNSHGVPLSQIYSDPPTHWMPLPAPPSGEKLEADYPDTGRE